MIFMRIRSMISCTGSLWPVPFLEDSKEEMMPAHELQYTLQH